MSLLFPAIRLPIGDYSSTYEASYVYDPLISGVDCEPEAVILRKVMNAKQAKKEPDLAHLFEQYKFINAGILDLISYHAVAGGNYTTIESAACAWLKDNFKIWETWVEFSEPCSRDGTFVWDNVSQSCKEAPKGGPSILVPALMVIPVVSAVVLSIAAFFMCSVRSPSHVCFKAILICSMPWLHILRLLVGCVCAPPSLDCVAVGKA